MKATLSLTHRCNLSCKYCYAGKSRKEDMSLETARKIVDFVLDHSPEARPIQFGYFGGEPLLRFDLIRAITEYVRRKTKGSGFLVNLGVTTNGTLLNRPILDYLRSKNIGLCVSIDGPRHVHDRNRCQANGTGSFERVQRGLQKALRLHPEVQVNAVFGPDTISSLLEVVVFLVKTGVSSIHLNPDVTTHWPKQSLSKIPKVFLAVADFYIDRFENGHELALNLIDSKAILFLKGGYGPEDKCTMGETEWGFAPSGNLYPCERFIGADDASPFCLGNIHSGLDHTRCCDLRKKRGNRNPECCSCSVASYCMNWCGCANYFSTRHTDLTGTIQCVSERAAIQAAEHVFISLTQRNNRLFINHLMRYSCERNSLPILN